MPTTSKSQTITKGTERGLVQRRLPTHRPPTHPGEMLLEVINGKRSVTPDTALRLARVTGRSADFWLGLQQDRDLWHALRSDDAAKIARLKPLAIVG